MKISDERANDQQQELADVAAQCIATVPAEIRWQVFLEFLHTYAAEQWKRHPEVTPAEMAEETANLAWCIRARSVLVSLGDDAQPEIEDASKTRH